MCIELNTATSVGLELLETLKLRGTVYTDCQGLVRKLLHRTSLGAPLPAPAFR